MNKAKLGLEFLNGLALWNGRGGFSLDGIREILLRLGNPQDSIPAIHVAGTNGKGSVSAAVAAILGAAGYRVGLNVSPHLEHLNERMVVDGCQVDDNFLGEFAYEVRNVCAKALNSLSFHEAITAIAFLGFREIGVEWMVVEVGLGGRLDASNVISRPAATGIVTIDYDHQHILGNTIGEIAREKAGIIKPGSPLVTGRLPLEAEKSIGDLARAAGVRWLRMSSDYGYEVPESSGKAVNVWCRDVLNQVRNTSYQQVLPGTHQLHNMAVAIALGSSVGVSAETCAKGVENVYWPARLEYYQLDSHRFLLDCAHNPAGIKAFISFLESQGVSGIDITFGVLDTKNWEEMVELLSPVVETWRLLRPNSERALDLEVLREKIHRVSGSDITVLNHGADYGGWLKGILDSDPGKLYALTGSMYLIGQLRKLIGVPARKLWSKAG